ncbi:MAG: hypothetical protein H0W50_01865 [Parachlamydiaceae bacterium]|nr:hypothetical protein [Parachlamydiaceae bacterium]
MGSINNNSPVHELVLSNKKGMENKTEEILSQQPSLSLERSGFSKASEAVGRVVLGSAGVALAVVAIVAGSPFLAIGGAAFLAYKLGQNAHAALKTKTDANGYGGVSPVKDFCKDQACKVGGQIKNFFSQRIFESIPANIRPSEANVKRAEIFQKINGDHDSNYLISESDRKFLESVPDAKVILTDNEINRLVTIHTKVMEREEVGNAMKELVSNSEEGHIILKDITGGIPPQAKAKLQGLINKMTPNDTPAKPLTRDEVKEAMLIIGKINQKKEIYQKLGEVGKYLLNAYKNDEKKILSNEDAVDVLGKDLGRYEIQHESDKEGLFKFTTKVLNFNERNKDIFISKRDADNVNELYYFYFNRANIGEINNEKFAKGLYLDHNERQELLKNQGENKPLLVKGKENIKDVEENVLEVGSSAISGSLSLANFDEDKLLQNYEIEKNQLQNQLTKNKTLSEEESEIAPDKNFDGFYAIVNDFEKVENLSQKEEGSGEVFDDLDSLLEKIHFFDSESTEDSIESTDQNQLTLSENELSQEEVSLEKISEEESLGDLSSKGDLSGENAPEGETLEEFLENMELHFQYNDYLKTEGEEEKVIPPYNTPILRGLVEQSEDNRGDTLNQALLDDSLDVNKAILKRINEELL